ncbi:DUF742 domain-containing protein [Actinomycetospora atypica]|uniref:DUF742 domain-containing protein n=1 Tax=Actinomycetospora atypica TaxID=1290095 RepID=A0ABV9YRQ1_9PSEU
MTDEREEGGHRAPPRRRPVVGRTGARFPRMPEPEAVEPAAAGPDAVDIEAAPPEQEPEPFLGRTGARFDSRARRRRRAEAAEAPALPPGSTTSSSGTPDPLLGRTGARFGSRARRDRREAERLAVEDAAVPVQAGSLRERYDPTNPCPDETPTAPLHLAELRAMAEGIESRVSVRPYVRTGGRTHARPDLFVETLISLPRPRPPLDDPEHRAIGDLCDDAPRSVAEVAALMQVPLGVARVLIGDMADDGSVRVHRTADDLSPGPGPDGAVLARVLRGLHRL